MIGVSTNGTVIQIECDPGEHLFIATAENKSAVRAQLMAGKVYDLIAAVKKGRWTMIVNLIPVKKGSDYRSRVIIYDEKLKHIALDRRRAAGYEKRHRRGIKAVVQKIDDGKWRPFTLSASDHR